MSLTIAKSYADTEPQGFNPHKMKPIHPFNRDIFLTLMLKRLAE